MSHTLRQRIHTRKNALAPSPHGKGCALRRHSRARGRGVKVATLPAPTQWRRRGFATWRIFLKPLTLTLSQGEREKRACITITLTKYGRRGGGNVHEPRLPGDNMIE